MNPLSQGSAFQAIDDASQTVGATERTLQPRLPEFRGLRQRQCIQATDASPIHSQNGFYHQSGANPGERTLIAHPLDHLGGEMENLFRIGEQASENGLTPFAAANASIPNQKVLR